MIADEGERKRQDKLARDQGPQTPVDADDHDVGDADRADDERDARDATQEQGELVDDVGELVDEVLDGLDLDRVVVLLEFGRVGARLEVLVDPVLNVTQFLETLDADDQTGVGAFFGAARGLDGQLVVLHRDVDGRRIRSPGVVVDDTRDGEGLP